MRFLHPLVLHNLDVLAACLTGTSTVLLAFGRRSGFVLLIAGSAAWTAVALVATFAGRPVWGQVASSVWTIGWAAWGFRAWQIDPKRRGRIDS